MRGRTFDALTGKLAGSSRRQILLVLSGRLVAGAAQSALATPIDAREHCYTLGEDCSRDSDCCEDLICHDGECDCCDDVLCRDDECQSRSAGGLGRAA